MWSGEHRLTVHWMSYDIYTCLSCIQLNHVNQHFVELNAVQLNANGRMSGFRGPWNSTCIQHPSRQLSWFTRVESTLGESTPAFNWTAELNAIVEFNRRWINFNIQLNRRVECNSWIQPTVNQLQHSTKSRVEWRSVRGLWNSTQVFPIPSLLIS